MKSGTRYWRCLPFIVACFSKKYLGGQKNDYFCPQNRVIIVSWQSEKMRTITTGYTRKVTHFEPSHYQLYLPMKTQRVCLMRFLF